MDPITKLQSLPYNARVKILWGTFLVIALALTVLIVQSINDTIGNAGGNLIKIEASKFVADSPIEYVFVERIEQTDKVMKIYFNFNNQTRDILNVPLLANIELEIDGSVINAQKITDRQGSPFVQKVLSRTQNFGIIYFPATVAKEGELTFSEMYLEKDPVSVFKQKIKLNLEELSKKTEVRN